MGDKYPESLTLVEESFHKYRRRGAVPLDTIVKSFKLKDANFSEGLDWPDMRWLILVKLRSRADDTIPFTSNRSPKFKQ